MKRHVFSGSVLAAALLLGAWLAPYMKGEDPARLETALVEFKNETLLLGALLKGDYLVVHDEESMAAGKPCTYVYRLGSGFRDKLAVSFHCQPVKREKTESFKIVVSPVGDLLERIEEIQFAGSSIGHKVP